MKRLLLAGFLSVSGCTVVQGTGQTSDGNAIAGTMEITNTSVSARFSPAPGIGCHALGNLGPGDPPWNLPVTCSQGATGTAQFSPDYTAKTDTMRYRLNNGERGTIVFGGATAVATQPGVAVQTQAPVVDPQIGTAIGQIIACAAGACAPPPDPYRTRSRPREVECRTLGNTVRCRERY